MTMEHRTTVHISYTAFYLDIFLKIILILLLSPFSSLHFQSLLYYRLWEQKYPSWLRKSENALQALSCTQNRNHTTWTVKQIVT